MSVERVVKVDGHELELSSLGKVLFPDSGVTKGDWSTISARVADVMVPLVKDRPLTMQRFTDGIDPEARIFPEGGAVCYLPDWIETVTFKLKRDGRKQRPDPCCLMTRPRWPGSPTRTALPSTSGLSRADRLDYPDMVIFDLDPPG